VQEAIAGYKLGRIKLPLTLDDDGRWLTIVAQVSRVNERESLVDTVYVGNKPCPPIIGRRSSVAKALIDAQIPADQQRTLRPFCEQAYARLKREGRHRPDPTNMYGSEPFRHLDYGYYHYVDVTRMVGAAGQETKHTSHETVCPIPGDDSSCEAIWKPLLAPMIAARDAERRQLAESEAAREALVAPLEAAYRARLERLAQSRASRKMQ
jgi:hypothetical protein